MHLRLLSSVQKDEAALCCLAGAVVLSNIMSREFFFISILVIISGAMTRLVKLLLNQCKWGAFWLV